MPLHDSGRAKPPNEPQHHAARPAHSASSIVKRSKRPGGIPGGRGSVRAGKGHRGSAGASPSQNLGHRTWEGEAPSEPDNATARQEARRPRIVQRHSRLARADNRSPASTDDRLISQFIHWSRSGVRPSVNSTRRLKRVPAGCVSDGARPTPPERALPYQLRCRQIRALMASMTSCSSSSLAF